MKKVAYIFLVFLTHFALSQSSVLSTGNWFKVGITKSGVYKLEPQQLAELGLAIESIDPRKFKIYGNGVKGILPQTNNELRPEDLLENAILVSGEADGSFDTNDFILFYAQGPNNLSWTNSGLTYEKNIYSDTAYYFITTGVSNGKRITEKANLKDAELVINTYDDFIVFEEDKNNLLNSGRVWYGDLIGNEERVVFQHTIEGISSDITMVTSAISQSPEANSFKLSVNGSDIGSLELGSIPTGDGTTYSIKARESTDIFAIDQNEELDLQFLFEANSASGRGFIDYYVLNFRRSLKLYADQTPFRHKGNLGVPVTYQLSNALGSTIWNVSDPTNVINQQYDQGTLTSFTSQSNEVEEFVIFTDDELPMPFLTGPVSNQNLRGTNNFDAIVVAHELFLEEAERLAQFHRDQDGLRVNVVTPTQIYNEFSSGRQDVTAIRDYAKHLYNNGSQLRYLLLFGDCSYDYKYRRANNTNFVPTYESRNSFHPIFSHSSDDYFGFFEENEGEWVESSSGDHTLEIGVGRLPAKNADEARTMVDKIIHYSTSPAALGKWRNQISYVADDGDRNIHARHVEDLAEIIDTTYSQYKIEKLLLDKFNQEVSATSERSPEATQALKTRIKEGTFTVNFIGHGNERLWMQEQVLTNAVIDELNNRNKLPIFITATCEFGRYDDPGQESGGERLLLKKNGGAIALLTTSRPVFASTNFKLNEAFHKNVFREVNDSNQRLGDIIRSTKNEGLAGPVNRNFTLLGDPMMMPAFPQLDIKINELSLETDTLSALDEITFTGQIIKGAEIDFDFNGTLDIDVFDQEQNFKTKGQENLPFTYSVRNNALFRGKSTVKNGTFSFTFIVPKTISYQFSYGQMSLYASDKLRNLDATGSSKNFVMGGTTESPGDKEAPSINMYLNDESFINGSSVGSSSVLFAEISDKNGITTTGNGLIQGISLALKDQVISLNEFYTANLDTYQSGMVVYPIQGLSAGDYTAILKVYDTHNNLTSAEIKFSVLEGNSISVFNPMVYPNPASELVTFSFEHDREEEDLEISLIVYNTYGAIVSKSSYEYENSLRLIELEWLAHTNSGQVLNRGIYFYRLIIKSRDDGALTEIANKLLITN